MYNFFKRLFDIIASLIALIILLPVFIPIIIILRISTEGEVFYFQERYGIYNSRFQIWKFATMLKNSMNIGTGSITLQNDPRVTKIGSFLRKTKINELPQIINILKGDISLVGPRPLVTKTFSAYNEEVQSKIYNVKPGLTGIGSIIFRDEESIPVRPGFTLYILDCTSSLYAVKVFVTKGLGPTKLISPFNILMICGSSLIFVFLKKDPIFVTLGSF